MLGSEIEKLKNFWVGMVTNACGHSGHENQRSQKLTDEVN